MFSFVTEGTLTALNGHSTSRKAFPATDRQARGQWCVGGGRSPGPQGRTAPRPDRASGRGAGRWDLGPPPSRRPRGLVFSGKRRGKGNATRDRTPDTGRLPPGLGRAVLRPRVHGSHLRLQTEPPKGAGKSHPQG